MNTGPLPIGQFVLPNGLPLANGYVLLRLNTDAQAAGNQICAGAKVRINLDEDGLPIGGPSFPANSTMLPNNTVYLLSAFTSAGILVYRDAPVIVPVPPITTGGFGTAFGSTFGS